ncbi:MAG: YbhB/YbcL family Raf kinase inhibitor-like protein [Ktedonobacteraceae bacterium]|nr:YbhB/YbcL family Raf kinase inhibitor-like protein [Ktedonobacteraceae bacterium]
MSRNPYENLPQVPSFAVTSTDIEDGKEISLPHTSGIFAPHGQDISPQLSWQGFPEGTKSFVVTMYDPDAPTPSGFWHWAVINIPAHVTELARGAGKPNSTELPAGAFQLPNDARLAQYVGAAPPAGHGKHHFYVVVTAVGVESLELDKGSTPAFLNFTLLSHTLGRAVMVPWSETQPS